MKFVIENCMERNSTGNILSFIILQGKKHFLLLISFAMIINYKLIIELDGKYHKYRFIEDEERTKILNHLGIKINKI